MSETQSMAFFIPLARSPESLDNALDQKILGVSFDDMNIVLRYAFRTAQKVNTFYYSQLDEILGRPLSRKQYALIGCLIGEFCQMKSTPLLNALLVRKNRRLPGSGFNEFTKNYDARRTHRQQRECWQTYQEMKWREFSREFMTFWENKIEA
jgi:hypothetical protein